MKNRQEAHHNETNRIIDDLERLRRFDGPPHEFWPAFLEGLARLAGARLAFLLVKEEADGSWKYLAIWPAPSRKAAKVSVLQSEIEEIAEASVLNGYAWKDIDKLKDTGRMGTVLGVRLELEEEERVSVAVFLADNGSGPRAEEVATRLKLVADIPAVYQLGRVVRQAKMDVVQFSEILDVMVLINEEKRYMAAAMTFCNEVASRYRCERVSLGWLEGDYVRLQAISHMEKFEKKMDAVQSLEAAMEEAFDQDEEILWPRTEMSAAVVRNHESFAKEQGSQYVVSLPIRLDDSPEGVLTCERSNEPFSEEVIRGLRLLCDQAARRLGDLKEHDRWFGARMMATVREGLGRLWGVEHTFVKLIGVLVCVALAVLLFGKMTYRVEAPFILKTDDLAYLPAPFDGYIDEVEVKVGDIVQEGSVLLKLDTRELLLEESTAIANQNRYVREAEKARTEKALADMKIAEALAQQAKARLDLVRYHLGHAEVKAPFAGIVVEGDLKELLGAPVKKGDVLFKVALLEKMYAELKIDERDVHELAGEATGEISFVSRPNLEFPIVVERVDPVAVTEEEGNVFLVRALFPEEVAGWWRPGMSGVAKINVGKRNILWILTHRTIDFLRIFLWW
jgi:RND family efflux transporter MFP subunit